MEITVEGEGTLTFWWKVSSDSGDELQFIADGVLKDDIDEEVDWNQKQYNVAGTGAHSFLWQYVKDGSEEDGDDRGFVDYVQWTGSPPSGGGAGWEEITYTYDPAGRRIEKDVDGDTTTYIYDGGNVIAEYNDAGSLSKKFIHGARIDELVCMIDVENSSAVYYYHYDGLGSVVALTNSSGNSCQSYQYSAYGQVAASDPNFTANPYLFTGRRFDYETGLYYYRARYYNPYIGRFLQTDPVGYGAGMNLYAYCINNPLNFVDPYGLYTVTIDIPLETIWHESSLGAIVDGEYVTEGDHPQHMEDVQKFLEESNFYDDFPGVILKSVSYSGSKKLGTYHCEFEVPDNYSNMKMKIEKEAGIPILVVETGLWGKDTQILDWRLIGMINDSSLKGGNITGGIIYGSIGTISAIVAWSQHAAGHAIRSLRVAVPGGIAIISYAAGIITIRDVVTDPNGSVPNFDRVHDYVDYINGFDGGIDSLLNQYEEYKKNYNLF